MIKEKCGIYKKNILIDIKLWKRICNRKKLFCLEDNFPSNCSDT